MDKPARPLTTEEMIDETLEDTFPASDPPTWDTLAQKPDEEDDRPLLDPELAD